MAEWFATPGDASRRADALSARWNALVAQAHGPGAKSRSDIPTELQEQIVRDQKRFRNFITSPTFGLYGMVVPRGWAPDADYEKLVRWHRKYKRRAKQVADALPMGETLVPEATPVKLPTFGASDSMLKAGRDLAILLGIGGAIFIGVKALSK